MHVGMATGFAHQGGDHGSDEQFIRDEISNLLLAEELGFDSVWITEHHFSEYSMSNDPLQLLTYIAAKTRHVKLGTQCIIVPWHNPARLAEKIVNLDILSNGRVLLGFGGGLAPHEFAGLGIDQNESRGALQRHPRRGRPGAGNRHPRRVGSVRHHPAHHAPTPADQELRGAQVLWLAIGQFDVLGRPAWLW